MEKGNGHRGYLLGSMRLLVALLLVMLIVPGFNALAADVPSDLPQITSYYPGVREDNPMELKPTTKAYVYFATGSAVASCKVAIEQNGEVIGSCVYYPTKGTTSNTLLMDPSKAENADIVNIPSGRFTLKFYEISYVANGVEKSYSDIDNPLGEITYYRNQPDGKVISTTGLDDRVVKSYYDVNSTEGVRVYKFDRAVIKDGIVARFEYGMGNTYTITPIPYSLSDDGTVLTIDLRGKCYNVDVLAPGVVFRDDNGDPCPPPTVVSISIDGLNCVDGTRISTYYISLEGVTSHLLSGSIYENFHYEDITFETPRLTKVEFYNKANPSTHYGNINEQTDMLELTVNNLSVIEKADIRLSNPSATETIAWGDITRNASSLVAAIPESIKKSGSEDLTVGLVNVVYTQNDGTEHTIAPLGASVLPVDIATIAELKALADGTNTVFNSKDGIRVSLSNEAGYTFAEDETGGIMVMTPDYKKVLHQGKTVTGKLEGTYVGNGIFMLNEAKSSFTETDADVSVGVMVNSISEINSGDLDNRLITVSVSDSFDIEYNDNGYLMINGYITVVTDFIEGYTAPSKVDNVTGVLYKEPGTDEPLLIVRSMDDFNKMLTSEPEIKEINSIAEIQEMDYEGEFVLNLTSAKVTYTNEDFALAIIEDATGGVMVYTDDDSLISDRGTAITGSVKAQRYDEYVILVTTNDESTSFTAIDVDVTLGAEISVAEAHDKANIYRLVTFRNSEEQPIISEPSGLNINDEIYCVDYFGEMWDVDFPESVESFTGIILPPLNFMGELDDEDEVSPVLIAVRDASDIVAKLTGINSAMTDTETSTDIYDLRGVKVVNMLKGGIYIVNGKKVKSKAF